MPLAGAALTLLEEPGEPGILVFPGTGRAGALLSDMTLTAVLRRMARRTHRARLPLDLPRLG